jgi:hypothetical protein
MIQLYQSRYCFVLIAKSLAILYRNLKKKKKKRSIFIYLGLTKSSKIIKKKYKEKGKVQVLFY